MIFQDPENRHDNAFVESFIASLRDECLNTKWFLFLDDARDKMDQFFRNPQ
ncbi:MAG: hypothetical protein C0390_09280 [Syntrophus sp. (in: bacteria)]|nr:hypothetical protein [Syntrophus sp. (in: bacteria)]